LLTQHDISARPYKPVNITPAALQSWNIQSRVPLGVFSWKLPFPSLPIVFWCASRSRVLRIAPAVELACECVRLRPGQGNSSIGRKVVAEVKRGCFWLRMRDVASEPARLGQVLRVKVVGGIGGAVFDS